MDSSPILVVEDDDLVRSFLCRALASIYGDVDACATGKDALRAVGSRRFGAILLDGLLPDIHGIELAKQLIVHPKATRSGICFVSGSLRHPLVMRDGVSALPKPLRLRDLLDAVGLLISWSHGAASAPASRMAALNVLSADLLVT
ncbi:MAG: response regulator [Candidatus Dormibacteraeota bacterium]|nr:response regulator [Candidatus Dormibacteraeota bacterium]